MFSSSTTTVRSDFLTALANAPLSSLSRILDIDNWQTALQDTVIGDDTYPKYDIYRTEQGDNYTIEIAVAGFEKADLKVKTEKSKLTVTGAKSKTEDHTKRVYTSKGIATRKFEISFNLPPYGKVAKAEVKNGILEIAIEVQVPEPDKARFTDII